MCLTPRGIAAGPAVLEKSGESFVLVIDGMTPGMHWELVVE